MATNVIYSLDRGHGVKILNKYDPKVLMSMQGGGAMMALGVVGTATSAYADVQANRASKAQRQASEAQREASNAQRCASEAQREASEAQSWWERPRG